MGNTVIRKNNLERNKNTMENQSNQENNINTENTSIQTEKSSLCLWSHYREKWLRCASDNNINNEIESMPYGN